MVDPRTGEVDGDHEDMPGEEMKNRVKDITTLSNVSQAMRRDLGSWLWRDVSLQMNPYEYGSNLDFLTSRPGIWPGIKTLRFGMVVRDDESLKRILDDVAWDDERGSTGSGGKRKIDRWER